MGAKHDVHVLDPSRLCMPLDEAPPHHAQQNIQRKMEATIRTRSGTIRRDLSQASTKDEVVAALKTDGWIIIKGGATIHSIAEARDSNKVNEYPYSIFARQLKKIQWIIAILSYANSNGFNGFKCILNVHVSSEDLVKTRRFARPDRWEDMVNTDKANTTEVVGIACYHLFGDPNSTWQWEYDKGLDKKEVGEGEVVSASGGDLYVTP